MIIINKRKRRLNNNSQNEICNFISNEILCLNRFFVSNIRTIVIAV